MYKAREKQIFFKYSDDSKFLSDNLDIQHNELLLKSKIYQLNGMVNSNEELIEIKCQN